MGALHPAAGCQPADRMGNSDAHDTHRLTRFGPDNQDVVITQLVTRYGLRLAYARALAPLMGAVHD